MRNHTLFLLAAALLATGCGRREEAPQADPAATAAQKTPAPAPHGNGEDWNASQIDWQPYEAGLAKAKAENKPVCLVFSTSWCPHCRNYSHVFADADVVAKARDFVMIHLNADENGDIARKYTPDGGYVPRTFFLSPDGTLAADIHAPRPKFLYFFDEHNPASLLAGMKQAVEKLRR